jgi:hypothetical protein
MPLRTMARLALTHADWAAMVQRSLRRGHSWAQSYADHRCCHDLTGDARAAIAPMGKWAWRDHLHVLEAVAVRAHPSEFSLLVEDMVVQEWWSSKFFDEQAASQATARCLVGRAVRGVSPQVVLDLFGVFTARRNPALRVIHCTESGDEHAAECGGFCADDEMATRAWSLRALTKPLGVSDAAVLRACLSQWQLSAEHTAMFLLNYVGTVWEMWDFTSADAARLAALAVELRLDGATVAALLCRLAAEEDAEQRAAASPPPRGRRQLWSRSRALCARSPCCSSGRRPCNSRAASRRRSASSSCERSRCRATDRASRRRPVRSLPFGRGCSLPRGWPARRASLRSARRRRSFVCRSVRNTPTTPVVRLPLGRTLRTCFELL